MAATSLVVRISADINDFARQLNKMTKDVEKAADKIERMGTAMTLGITVPVAAATVMLAKFAVENDRIAQQFARSFGPNAQMVKTQLEALAQVLPQTSSQIEAAAIRLNNISRGLGLAAPQAAQLSVELLKMSNDLAAFAGVDQEEALSGLLRGLEGSTKGLKNLGVVIDATMVKQEAYHLGLLRVGQDLTPTGTALATYSLIVKQAALWTGRGAEAAADAAGSWRGLWRDMVQLADDASNVLIPVLKTIAQDLRGLVAVARDTPPWILKTAGALLVLAAVIGPTILVVSKLTRAFVLLRAAVSILLAGKGMGALVALLGAPEVIGALVALGLTVGGLTYLWLKFSKALEATPNAVGKLATPNAVGKLAPPNAVGKLAPPMDVQSLMRMGGVNDPTSMATGDPLQQLQKSASLAEDAFNLAISTGDRFEDTLNRIAAVQKEAYKIFDKSSDKFGEMAQGAAKVYFTLRDIRTEAGVAFSGGDISKASRALLPHQQIQSNLAKGLINVENEMRTREAAIKLPDTFDAMREAALRFAEGVRDITRDIAVRSALLRMPVNRMQQVEAAVLSRGEAQKEYEKGLIERAAEAGIPLVLKVAMEAAIQLRNQFKRTGDEFSIGWQKFKSQWSSPKAIGQGAMAGAQLAMSQLLVAIDPVTLAFMAFGKVLEPIMKLLDMVMVPLTALGEIIAIMLIPIMKPLFEALKILGIVVSFLGEVMARVSAGIATAVGYLIQGLGKVISWIPGLGGVGKALQRFGDFLLGFAADQYKTADDLKKARERLEAMGFGDTMKDFANATRDATEALLNVPTGFKIALARFDATAPITGTGTGGNPINPIGTGGGGGSGGGGDGGGGGGGGDDGTLTPVYLMLDGQVLASGMIRSLQRKSSAQFGTSLRWAEVQG